jgi:D-alanine-D-alanine ligase
MRVAVLHNAVGEGGSPDERDVLVQTGVVSEALAALGHAVTVLPCDLNLALIKRRLLEAAPDIVFNLVESLEGSGALIHLAPFLLEGMGLCCTGASGEAMMLSSNKIAAKTHLRAAGLPTPDWIGPYPHRTRPLQTKGSALGSRRRATWIIKSVWEHASIGLDEEGLLHDAGPEAVLATLVQRAPELGGACFAEAYIDGREFNLSILAGPSGPVVLPPAEIRFEGYGPEKPRIVGYRAKWDADAYEYIHTPRSFDFPKADGPLLAALTETALSAWDRLGVGGYARVDFRVDSQGTPWILEVNANPCLSPDAGFAAALARAGIPFREAVDRILAAALAADGKAP